MYWKSIAVLFVVSALGGLTLWNSSDYILVTTYVAKGGAGTVPIDVFSRNLLLAPSIQGYQERLSAELYINSRPVNFTVKVDNEGNEYPYVGEVAYTGFINVTLVQRVRVYAVHSRSYFGVPASSSWPATRAGSLPRNSFWRCNTSAVGLRDLRSISNRLAANASGPVDFAYKVARWALSEAKYEESYGGISCPSAFLKEKKGACGDFSAFIAALLKIQGLNAYLVYSLVEDQGAYLNVSTARSSFLIKGAYPHVFTVLEVDGYRVPIDATANVGGDPIRGAVALNRDGVVILYKVVNSDPNDYLILYAPGNDAQVYYSIVVKRNQGTIDAGFGWSILGVAVAIVLVLGKRLDASDDRE